MWGGGLLFFRLLSCAALENPLVCVSTSTTQCCPFMGHYVNEKPEAVRAAKLGWHWNDPVNFEKLD